MVYSLLKRVHGTELKELRQGLQGLLCLPEQRWIKEILRGKRLAVMVVHPGLKLSDLGLIESHTRHECRRFLRRQRQAQAQTGWATTSSHALVEFLKDHPGDKTLVQQTSNDLSCSPMAALHWRQEHITLRGPEQLAVKQVAPDSVAQTQVVLRHLEDTQGREVLAQRLQHHVLLDQGIFMHEKAITRANHDHIVMEGAGINGARVLARHERAVWEELTEARHRQASFAALPCRKHPW